MPKAPRKPLPARRRAGRAVATASLIFLGAVSVYGGFLYSRSNAIRHWLPQFFGNVFHPKSPADVFPGQQAQALNLMVIGRDYDYNDKDQVIKTHARSDMLMVARVDFSQKNVTLLSIPRDTSARIPGHGITKINAAHAYGGPPLSEQTVQDNFGIPCDKYVALDFQGFETAIDLLGGVDLTVDKKMDYDDNWGHLHIHLLPGFQHLNGQQAMGFVRFRHSDSDLVRVQRQQTLLAALKAKLREPQTLAKLPALLDTINNHIDSDLSDDQKIVLANFIHDTPREAIRMETLPSNEEGDLVATDWPKAAPMIQNIFDVMPPENMAEAPEHHRRHHRRRFRVAELP